jgi:3'-5' exoribonuclease
MESAPLRDLKEGDIVLRFFQLKSRDLRKTRAGQDYVDLTLGDATGTIPAKMWSDAVRKWGHEFSPGDFVKVEGRVESYRDRFQIIVDKIRRADPSEIPDVASLVRAAAEDAETLFSELKDIAAALEPPQLAQLVCDILDHNAAEFKTSPAARMIHHAYQGGLIEHTRAVTRKIEAILALEKGLNRSVAIAGGILHDMGKILEFNPSGAGRTRDGRLIGHVTLGVKLVREAATRLGVTDCSWLTELEHIILSHHGESEFGAPVRPLTREAMVVHFIDNLDSKLKIMDEALEQVDSEGFTHYNKWLEGRAYAGDRRSSEEDDSGDDSRKTG